MFISLGLILLDSRDTAKENGNGSERPIATLLDLQGQTAI